MHEKGFTTPSDRLPAGGGRWSSLWIFIAILAVSVLVICLLDVPRESRETALLTTLAGALAVVVGIGITVFFMVAQLYSPYRSGVGTLVTWQTRLYVAAFLLGILLPLFVLQGARLPMLSREPFRFLGVFQLSWAHGCLIWFTGCLIALPWYVRHAQQRVGPRGIVLSAETKLLSILRTATRSKTRGGLSAWTLDKFQQQLQYLLQVGLTAIEHSELPVFQLAFDSLGRVFLEADATARSTAQLKGRADVVRQGQWILPLPPGQRDPWRIVYREMGFLHTSLCRFPHMMLGECHCLTTLGHQSVQDSNSRSTCLATVHILTQVMDRAVDTCNANVTEEATTATERLVKAAVTAAIPKDARPAEQREYFFAAANQAIAGIGNALVPRPGEQRLQQIPRTQAWEQALRRVIQSVRGLARAILTEDSSPVTAQALKHKDLYMMLKQHLDDHRDDELIQKQPADISRRAVELLKTLRLELDRCLRADLAGEAASIIGELGRMAAHLGWVPATVAALSDQKDVSLKLIRSASYASARNAINSMKDMTLTGVLQAKEVSIALSGLLLLTQLARETVTTPLSLEIIGGSNGVVTILEKCRHQLALPPKRPGVLIKIEANLGSIVGHMSVSANLKQKALRATHELSRW